MNYLIALVADNGFTELWIGKDNKHKYCFYISTNKATATVLPNSPRYFDVKEAADQAFKIATQQGFNTTHIKAGYLPSHLKLKSDIVRPTQNIKDYVDSNNFEGLKNYFYFEMTHKALTKPVKMAKRVAHLACVIQHSFKDYPKVLDSYIQAINMLDR